jgi:hypothetical protein
MVSLTSTPAVREDAARSLYREIRDFWQQFFVQAFSPYRPELHYMRGPGPAWQAKHGPDSIQTDWLCPAPKCEQPATGGHPARAAKQS